MTTTDTTTTDTTTARPTAPATTAGHDHPVRGRWNSLFFHLMRGTLERELGGLRDEVAADVRGEVVEIGPGNGPMFTRLPAGTRVHAIEPNRHFHGRLRDSATAAGVDLVLHHRGAEAIDLPDDSVDTVVATWVLCTVADPAAVVAEIRRVLRPGGRFVGFEHVAAPDGSDVRRLQRALRRPWGWLWEGCSLERDTASVLRAAGFADVEVQRRTAPTAVVPVRPTISFVATA